MITVPFRQALLSLLPFGLQLPSPFCFRAGIGSHLPRLSVAPLEGILLLFSAFALFSLSLVYPPFNFLSSPNAGITAPNKHLVLLVRSALRAEASSFNYAEERSIRSAQSGRISRDLKRPTPLILDQADAILGLTAAFNGNLKAIGGSYVQE